MRLKVNRKVVSRHQLYLKILSKVQHFRLMMNLNILGWDSLSHHCVSYLIGGFRFPVWQREVFHKKSRIRETQNLSTDADSRTDTITFFHQKIAGDGHALQGDRLALLCFFHQEIAGEGWLFEETDWLCSPGRITYYYIFSSRNCRWWTCFLRRQTGFAPLGPPLIPWENRMKGDI